VGDEMADPVLSRTEWITAALERYELPLVRYVCRMTGDVEVARDVVQDAFLRLCKADRERVEGRLAAWLYTVCRNRALDVLKKEGRMGRLTDAQAVADPNTGGGPGEMAARSEMHGMILEALEGLTEEQREAFRLKFQDDLSYREISEVLGISLGSVSKLISTALGTIRDRLRTRYNLAQEG
jgi:RNA polymerase sigma-70 factor (ECF subfamily)